MVASFLHPLYIRRIPEVPEIASKWSAGKPTNTGNLRHAIWNRRDQTLSHDLDIWAALVVPIVVGKSRASFFVRRGRFSYCRMLARVDRESGLHCVAFFFRRERSEFVDRT
jgi:hypothetical protein